MSGQTRVIVGVHDSLTGLRALREAVAIARQRGAELRAVRTHAAGDAGYQVRGWQLADPCRGSALYVPGCEKAAGTVVQRAFCQAFGGMPAGVPVQVVSVPGRPRRALVEQATREDDLLVVGASRRRRWWWPFRRTMGRYCALHASCPVLVVPTAPAARELGSRRLRWRLRAHRELSRLLAPAMSETTR